MVMMATSKLPILCSQAPYGQDCCCCQRCSVGGCDLKVIPCGCCLHARCCPVSDSNLLRKCPVCGVAATRLHVIPLVFDEIDQATAEAAQTTLTNKRGKKRQNATIARLNPASHKMSTSASTGSDEGTTGTSVVESNELRTGRWTPEETAYCDKLIFCFEQGSLPIPDKIKLNDFLSNMLKSKQSRLTKKMKNANLSAKQYKRSASFIDDMEAREISQLETELFASIKCRMERSELRFHMQKVWRDLFANFCAKIGQKLELDGWLRSVEEMERRTAEALDTARRARRKAMIGYALTEDTKNAQSGVLIDANVLVDRSSQVVFDQNGEYAEMGSESESVGGSSSSKRPRNTSNSNSAAVRARANSTSFVARVMHYVQLRKIPFEHVDVWVPSSENNIIGGTGQGQRLAFGGCATADSKVLPNDPMSVSLTSKEQYDLVSFGEYSQRFSFDLGSGLPGRVFSSGIPSWEQGIKSAPRSLFERCCGARQWGIETALGMPINSPSVGRIVVVLYSIHDRSRDQDMVSRMMEDVSNLLPMPRWKLVVDVGSELLVDVVSNPNHTLETDLRNLLQSLLGGNANPSISQQIAGLVPLCQVLAKNNRSEMEQELLMDALHNFENYKRQGRGDTEVAWLTCRDFMLKEALTQKQNKGQTCTDVFGCSTGEQNCSNASEGNCEQPASASTCCPNSGQPYEACMSSAYTVPGCCMSTSGPSGCLQPTSSCCAPSSGQQNKFSSQTSGRTNGNFMFGQSTSDVCANGNPTETDAFGQEEFGRDVAVLNTSLFPTTPANLHQNVSNCHHPDNISESEEHSAIINGSLDFGVSAIQLSQLLQSDANNFHN
ncbi:hypothetical protein ACA910_016314 [Epithemia clementina (nom. ined.)]